jgi:hypothetical protein
MRGGPTRFVPFILREKNTGRDAETVTGGIVKERGGTLVMEAAGQRSRKKS